MVKIIDWDGAHFRDWPLSQNTLERLAKSKTSDRELDTGKVVELLHGDPRIVCKEYHGVLGSVIRWLLSVEKQ
jgi:hypothetical protein